MGTPVDYVGIRNTIKQIIEDATENDQPLEGAQVFVEEEPQFGLSDAGVAIAVFMDNRTAPENEQVVSAGKRTRYHLRVTFWVIAFDLGGFRAACDKRDDTLGKLELLLMENRTIDDKVETSWLEGGEMYSAKDGQASVYTSVAEVVMTLKVSAINI